MARSGGTWPKIRSQLKRLFVWIVVVAIVAITVGLAYFTIPYEGTDASIEAVEDDERVTVDRTDLGYVLQPADSQMMAPNWMGSYSVPRTVMSTSLIAISP